MLFLSLMALSCVSKEGKPSYKAKPALRISPIEVSSTRGTFLVETLNATGVNLLCLESKENAPSTDEIIGKGEHTTQGEYLLMGLEGQKDYVLYGVATDDKGQRSSICKVPFSTLLWC